MQITYTDYRQMTFIVNKSIVFYRYGSTRRCLESADSDFSQRKHTFTHTPTHTHTARELLSLRISLWIIGADTTVSPRAQGASFQKAWLLPKLTSLPRRHVELKNDERESAEELAVVPRYRCTWCRASCTLHDYVAAPTTTTTTRAWSLPREDVERLSRCLSPLPRADPPTGSCCSGIVDFARSRHGSKEEDTTVSCGPTEAVGVFRMLSFPQD